MAAVVIKPAGTTVPTEHHSSRSDAITFQVSCAYARSNPLLHVQVWGRIGPSCAGFRSEIAHPRPVTVPSNEYSGGKRTLGIRFDLPLGRPRPPKANWCVPCHDAVIRRQAGRVVVRNVAWFSSRFPIFKKTVRDIHSHLYSVDKLEDAFEAEWRPKSGVLVRGCQSGSPPRESSFTIWN